MCACSHTHTHARACTPSHVVAYKYVYNVKNTYIRVYLYIYMYALWGLSVWICVRMNDILILFFYQAITKLRYSKIEVYKLKQINIDIDSILILKNLCQQWGSNPRPHSWTRCPNSSQARAKWFHLESGALDHSTMLTVNE